MTREEELQRLIEEQRKDDTYEVRPERHVSFSLDATLPGSTELTFADVVGIDVDGQVRIFAPRPMGHVLVGSKIPHGTSGGYTNWKCRCASCRKAHTAEWMRRYHERLKHDPTFKRNRAASQRKSYRKRHPAALTLSERATKAAKARHAKPKAVAA